MAMRTGCRAIAADFVRRRTAVIVAIEVATLAATAEGVPS
jgi:hypothetical protein